MYSKLTIVVPSANRAGKVRCLAQLPPALRERTVLAVPNAQLDDYLNAAMDPTQVAPVIAVPDTIRGIAATRQYVSELVYSLNGRFLLFISDDVQFFRRKSCSDIHLRPVNSDDVQEMVDTLMELTAETGHAGVSARGGNNRQPDPIKLSGRMCDVYMHDLELMRELGIRWDRVPVMEDFDVTLQLLRHGYPNAILYEWAWDQPGSNAPGGCSTYRTWEVQKQGATALHALHPDYVKVVEKPSKNWNGFDTRFDVVVQWKRAMERADLSPTGQVVTA